jgi:hypothetical protein
MSYADWNNGGDAGLLNCTLLAVILSHKIRIGHAQKADCKQYFL